FARDPALRPLFTTPLAEQEIKFAQKLTEIVRAMPRLEELLAHTRALGARHVGYGARAADYQTLGNALLAALAAVLGDSFDAPTREAWTLAYNLVAEIMLEGAAAARPLRRWPPRPAATIPLTGGGHPHAWTFVRYAWTVTRCGVIFGLRLMNQPGS